MWLSPTLKTAHRFLKQHGTRRPQPKYLFVPVIGSVQAQVTTGHMYSKTWRCHMRSSQCSPLHRVGGRMSGSSTSVCSPFLRVMHSSVDFGRPLLAYLPYCTLPTSRVKLATELLALWTTLRKSARCICSYCGCCYWVIANIFTKKRDRKGGAPVSFSDQWQNCYHQCSFVDQTEQIVKAYGQSSSPLEILTSFMPVTLSVSIGLQGSGQ